MKVAFRQAGIRRPQVRRPALITAAMTLGCCSAACALTDMLARKPQRSRVSIRRHTPAFHGRVRREDGNRHEVAHIDPTLVADLQRLVEPVTMGDQERPLKWVSKNPVKLADELSNMAAICTYPTIEPIGGLRFGTALIAIASARADASPGTYSLGKARMPRPSILIADLSRVA